MIDEAECALPICSLPSGPDGSCSIVAPLMSRALINAALGCGWPAAKSPCRSTAAHPETNGVAILVPELKVQRGSLLSPKRRRSSLLKSGFLDAADRIAVPGATKSGF